MTKSNVFKEKQRRYDNNEMSVDEQAKQFETESIDIRHKERVRKQTARSKLIDSELEVIYPLFIFLIRA